MVGCCKVFFVDDICDKSTQEKEFQSEEELKCWVKEFSGVIFLTTNVDKHGNCTVMNDKKHKTL